MEQSGGSSWLLWRPPSLVMLNQPQRRYRFRYESEMNERHGFLMAETARGHSSYVQVQNCADRQAWIRCSLATSSPNQERHVHKLSTRNGQHLSIAQHRDFLVSPNNNWTATLNAVNVIAAAKRDVQNLIEWQLMNDRGREGWTPSLYERQQLADEAYRLAHSMNLHVVRLKFEALAERNGSLVPLGLPIYSSEIHNAKCTQTADLHITRISQVSGLCTGNEEVFILVKKVSRKDIRVRFFQVNEDHEVTWQDYADFSEHDVHYQHAIVFKTPAYRDVTITRPVSVFFQLFRPSDEMSSEPRYFTYVPRASESNQLVPASDTGDRVARRVQYPQPSLTAYQHSDSLPNASSALPEWSPESDSIFPSDGTDYSSPQLDFTLLLNLDDDVMDADCSVKLKRPLVEKLRLHISVLKNQTEAVALLLQSGTDPSAADMNGNSPIHLAAADTHLVDCLHLLLHARKAALKLNQRNYAGLTPLHMAVNASNLKAVEMLVAKGSDVNCHETKRGRTALHLAVKRQASDIISLLLRNPALDVNRQSYDGNTALNLAKMDGLSDIGATLMHHGADPQIENYLQSKAMSESGSESDDDDGDEQEEGVLEVADEAERANAFDFFTLIHPSVMNIVCEESRTSERAQVAAPEAAKIGAAVVRSEVPSDEGCTKAVDSGIDLMASRDLSKDLSESVIEELARLLDNGKDWERLAEALDIGLCSMRAVFDKQTSPTTYLLRNLDLWDLTTQTVLEKLQQLYLTEAFTILENHIHP